jgi:hypothetical protein
MQVAVLKLSICALISLGYSFFFLGEIAVVRKRIQNAMLGLCFHLCFLCFLRAVFLHFISQKLQ